MQVLLKDIDFINFFKYHYLFFLGASIGSFYKTIYDRILYFFYSNDRKKYTLKEKYINLFFKPSFCFNCKNKINSIYLIPVFGYFITKGKCKKCNTKISYQNIFWEVFGGILICYFYYFFDFISLLYLLIFFHFLIAGLIDLKKFFIDYENIIFLYLFGIIQFLLNYDFSNLYSLIIKFLIFFSLLLFIYFLGKGKKFGFGDVILIGAISIIFNIPEILIILHFGSIGSILYILLYKKNKKAYAPLGFFLSIGSVFILILQPIYSIEHIFNQLPFLSMPFL